VTTVTVGTQRDYCYSGNTTWPLLQWEHNVTTVTVGTQRDCCYSGNTTWLLLQWEHKDTFCVFPYCFINGQSIIEEKMLFLRSKTFLILRLIERDVHRSSCKVLLIFVGFWWKLNFFLDILPNNTQTSNFMKILPVRACYSIRTEGYTDTHDEDNSRFLECCERV